MTRRMWPLLVLLALSLVGHAGARRVTTCGQARIEVTALTPDRQRLTLRVPGSDPVVLEDSRVGVQWCRDVTGDGQPEALLMQYSGGAHCCSVHSLYTTHAPLRRLLHADSINVYELVPRQLDGRGALELLSYDNRFAYAFGLCFACSPFPPLVYALRDGRYVNDTRSFPGLIRARTNVQGVPQEPGDALMGLTGLLVLGPEGDLPAYLRALPDGLRAWLESYLPDIRQTLSDYGLADWPLRAGLSEARLTGPGLGGAFTAPGRTEYLTLLRQPGSRAADLHLFQAREGRIVASPILLSLPQALDDRGGLDVVPAFVVRLGNGQARAVLRDERGGVTFTAYRIGAERATPLSDDALATFSTLLGDLATLARRNAALSDSQTRRTASQLAGAQRQAEQARSEAGRWPNEAGVNWPAEDLGTFDVQALEMEEDARETATLSATVNVGRLSRRQDGGYLPTVRQRLSATLSHDGGNWRVTGWTLTNLVSEPPQ